MSSRLSESLSQNIKCKIIEQDSHYQRVYAHTCKYMKIYIYIYYSPHYQRKLIWAGDAAQLVVYLPT